ncbi:MAG TPA: hypothetical protein VGZ52_00745, partial [Acidimicrobiales bacterium]|nr:hypothetical protein [Acidimicrobiales bacterium]
DVYWWADPFDTIGRVYRNDDSGTAPETETVDPHWTAAALLFAFVWFVFAYPEFYPPSPHELGWFLAAYTVAVVAGMARWGRAWVKEGEGFGALFGLLARRRERPASSGTVALLSVYLGAILFDAVSQTNWWINVLGTSRGWNERVINTVGLLWSVVAVSVLFVGACWIAGRFTERATREVTERFAPMLVPLGLAWSVAHYLSAFLVDLQNFIALLSDPLGEGWDLFHTIDNVVDYRWLTPLQTGLLQVAVLLAGCVASALVVHRVAFTTFRGRAAVRATYPLAAALILAAVGAVALLLGT